MATIPDQSPVMEGALYEDISKRAIYAYRGAGIIAVAMVILAFIFCLVQGTEKHTLYLLASNLVISSFVGVVNGWWYKNGDLASDKYWFLILVCGVIIFQCLATDIFVFNYPKEIPITTTTVTTIKPNGSTTTVPSG